MKKETGENTNYTTNNTAASLTQFSISIIKDKIKGHLGEYNKTTYTS